MRKISKVKNKGFTLVELLVVIGIIGILAAMILPKFTGYIEKAIMKEAVSYARTVNLYLTSYYVENGEYPSNKTGGDIIREAGITIKPNDVLTVIGGNVENGNFTLKLIRGKKSYTVKYHNGVITETPPSK